jgi:ABC-2 type transport system ATP-binding protein
MRAGRVVAAGTLDELAVLARPSVVVETPALEAAAAVLRRLGAASAVADPDGLRVRADLPDTPVEDVTRALVRADVPVRGIGRSGRSLEDLFVELTGEGFDVAG